MLRKILVCCTPIVVLAMLAMPAIAAVTVSYPAITHSWPAQTDGSRLLISTMAGTIYNDDPNGLYADGSPPYQKVGENFNDRLVSETFTVPADSNGLTLTHLVITATGGGADTNLPMSLHIYDLNTAAPFGITPTVTNYILSGGTGAANTANSAMLAPGEFLPPTSFVFRRDASSGVLDTFVDFNLTGLESFDLEPNHMYTFEIWPTKGNDPGWNWIRGTATNAGGGLCYRVDSPSDYRNLATTRSAVATGTRTAVLGVYGIPTDGNAYRPIPRNMDTGILLDSQLKWRRGKWCGPGNDSNHVLYLHTDAFNVEMRDISARKGRLTDVNFTDVNEPNWKPPTNLLADKWYYWRVDEYNNVTKSGYWGRSAKGYWSFKTSGPQAAQPSPVSPSAVTEFKPTNALLSWVKGCYVGSADLNAHKVYFGTSYADVNDANEPTTGAPIYRGAVTDPCYPLRNLAGDYTLTSGTTYYWRIDEVNATIGTAKGVVWNFTMPNPAYILLDNFGYQSLADLGVVWQSGYKLPYGGPGDQNTNGGSISVAGNIMDLSYNNSYSTFGPWSEAKLDYKFNGSTGVDWTFGGAFVPKALAVQFDGNMGNTLNSVNVNNDKLYMGIEDIHGNLGVVYHNSDVYAAQRAITLVSGNAAIREWKVALTDPNFSTVDLNEVNRVYLGIGSPRGAFQNVGYGGQGLLHYANLKVYAQHCKPIFPTTSLVAGDLAGPLSGLLSGDNSRYTTPDCVVNVHDIFYFTRDWLFNEPNLVYDSNVNPTTSNLTAWYKFDEGPGSTNILDDSGNGRNATLYNLNLFTWAYTGHDGTGYSVNLEPGYRTWIECPNTVVANFEGQTGQSFTFWLKYNDSFAQEHMWASVLLFHRSAPGAGAAQTIETQLPDPFTPGQRAMPWVRWVDMRISKETALQKVRASSISGRWNHYALVYDTSINPDPNISPSMRIYVNGAQIAGLSDGNIARVWGPNDTGDGNANTVRIGTRDNVAAPTGQFWQGRIDDMRLYSKALSQNEVRWLATDGTGKRDMQALFNEPTDFNNVNTATLPAGQTVKIINFRDYAVLAGYWLNQQLWPN